MRARLFWNRWTTSWERRVTMRARAEGSIDQAPRTTKSSSSSSSSNQDLQRWSAESPALRRWTWTRERRSHPARTTFWAVCRGERAFISFLLILCIWEVRGLKRLTNIEWTVYFCSSYLSGDSDPNTHWISAAVQEPDSLVCCHGEESQTARVRTCENQAVRLPPTNSVVIFGEALMWLDVQSLHCKNINIPETGPSFLVVKRA